MKTNYFLLGAVLILSCFSSQAKAQTQIDGIAYDTITIKGVKVAQTVSLPKDGDTDVRYSQSTIVIPATVDLYGTTYPVKKIGDSSMRNNNNLTSITFPDGLEIIGNSSFASCEYLPSVVLPSTVNSIEDWAFYGNKALASINIPDGVPAMTEHTFQESGLTSIVLPPSVTSIKVCAFQNCTKLASINLENITEIIAWSMYGTALTSVHVNNVLSLGDCSFSKIPTLESVVLNNVGEIGDWSFQDCVNLTSVTLSGTEMIQSGAFSGCTLLTSLRLPSSVAFIANWSLEKSGITSMYASWANPLTDVIIEANAFGNGEVIFKWYVPESVFYGWEDFFLGYLVELDNSTAVANLKLENGNVFYNSGKLSLNNMAGYRVSVISVDGRSIANFVVEGNNFKADLKLNAGVYVIKATNGNKPATAKFIVK